MQVLARAIELARLTVSSAAYDVRHLVASLTLPDGRGSNENVIEEARRVLGVEITGFGFELVARLVETPGDTEDKNSWAKIAKSPPSAPAQPGSGVRIALAGFDSDRPRSFGTDPLQIGADVRALARLICLEEATPPLSICIFGDWGSGKSTFMEALEAEVDYLTKESCEREPKKGEPRFIEDVIQIRFNAWHYADANLWASITAEFFSQLRRGGHERGQTEEYQSLVKNLAKRLRSRQAGEASTLRNLKDAEKELRKTKDDLEATQKTLKTKPIEIAGEHLAQLLEAQWQEPKNVEKLRKLGQHIGRTDLHEDINSFAETVKEASTVPGELGLIVRVLSGGGLTTWLGAAAILLLVTFWVLFVRIDLGRATTLIDTLWGGSGIALLASFGTGAVSLWQAIKAIKPILDGVATYGDEVEAQKRKLQKEMEDQERLVEDAQLKLILAEEEQEIARKALLAYGSDVKADTPEALLRYFLFDDSSLHDYEKQVGIVSRARRSFEQLNAIVAEARSQRTARAQLAHKPIAKPSPNALELGAVPDRIVLYIDDLDRCTHKQVYDVLQAIHLLLAFELFVVVVGVDVRWIEAAVAEHFEANFAPDAAPSERSKRAIDYLEKIFQIPFWLRPLTTQNVSGVETAATYSAYVNELLRDAPLATQAMAAFRLTPASAELGENQSAARRANVAPISKTEKSVEIVRELETAWESVRLTEAEKAFLASKEIGAIAGKSPRAVKRLVNIYRILRAHRSGPDLDRFLGKGRRVSPLSHFGVVARRRDWPRCGACRRDL